MKSNALGITRTVFAFLAIPDWAPTIADVLKEPGYVTAQFGKNHLGDQDNHLPTNHGFDEFFGNLYHLSNGACRVLVG